MHPTNIIMRNKRGVIFIVLAAVIGGAVFALMSRHHHNAAAIQQNGWQIEAPHIFSVVPGGTATVWLSCACQPQRQGANINVGIGGVCRKNRNPQHHQR